MFLLEIGMLSIPFYNVLIRFMVPDGNLQPEIVFPSPFVGVVYLFRGKLFSSIAMTNKQLLRKSLMAGLKSYPIRVGRALREHVSFIKIPLDDLRSWQGQIKAARSVDVELLAALPPHAMREALEYRDSVLLHKSLAVPVPWTVNDWARDTGTILEGAFEKLNMYGGARRAALDKLASSEIDCLPVSDEWSNYVQCAKPDNQRILERTDKDTYMSFN